MSSEPLRTPYQIGMEASYGIPHTGKQPLPHDRAAPSRKPPAPKGNMRLPIGQDHAPLIEQPQLPEKEQIDGKDKLPLQRQT